MAAELRSSAVQHLAVEDAALRPVAEAVPRPTASRLLAGAYGDRRAAGWRTGRGTSARDRADVSVFEYFRRQALANGNPAAVVETINTGQGSPYDAFHVTAAMADGRSTVCQQTSVANKGPQARSVMAFSDLSNRVICLTGWLNELACGLRRRKSGGNYEAWLQERLQAAY